MMTTEIERNQPSRSKVALGSKGSVVVENCQICSNTDLKSVLFLGYLPPVNTMPLIGSRPSEKTSYPAELLYCPKCHLVQLGLTVDAGILFPPEYPYTSGTTKVLRENFAELYQESSKLLGLKADDLIVDIGSNDGTLLSNFAKDHRVQGVTPEQMGKLAIERGIPTIISFFNQQVVDQIVKEKGQAKVVTATNVFAHIENVHDVIKGIKNLIKEDGVFISESHYLLPLIQTVQYDTIYHEHLRYYSLHALQYLFKMHGLEIFHAKQIPSHGGSVRVYAARPGKFKIDATVQALMTEEKDVVVSESNFEKFKQEVLLSKLALHSLILDQKKKGNRIYGVGAPSRASTLVNYVGLDDGILDCVLEIKGSYKIGKYMPGTMIPVLEESKLFTDQPEVALLLSWHIADEIAAKFREKGFKGKFLVPLPVPRLI
jgi:hypothetical protein